MSKVLNEWTFGGVRLDSFGPVTELDAYLDMPPKRGDNVLIPMRHGKVFVPKYFDQRTIPFGIEVTGDDISDLEQKMDRAKALFGSRAQQALANNFCDGPRSALAEVLTQLGPTRDPDPLIAKIVVDFLLADPFFRGYRKRFAITGIDWDGTAIILKAANDLSVGDHFRVEGVNAGFVVTGMDGTDWICSTGSDASNIYYIPTAAPTGATTQTANHGFVYASVMHTLYTAGSPYIINNPGTAPECNAIITFGESLDQAILSNLTNGVTLQYNALIGGGGGYVNIDCGNKTAFDQAGNNVIGNVVHSGDAAFMILEPGDNLMTITDNWTTAGPTNISSFPPYL